jgi:flagellar biosynthesis protein FlhA
LTQDEAQQRRREVAQESEFYGSMDGASKFIRGDAVAGILILFINIIGGLIVGVLQHDMGAGDAAKVYTLLTIGDGLVAQIPALIISTAAGLVVTRVASDQDVGQQLVAQLFGNPMVLALTAAILGILGMIPGMPNLVFLLLAGSLGYLAWRQFSARSDQRMWQPKRLRLPRRRRQRPRKRVGPTSPRWMCSGLKSAIV